MKGKDLVSISDLTAEDIGALIADAAEMKARGATFSALEGKILALLFEKPSLRTRVSFEVAMRQLGGQVIYLSPAEVGLGQRESVSDVARVLSSFVSAIAARTFSHETLEMLASYSDIPVINALSDLEHPCQALGDLLTIGEKKGELQGLTIAYIGDGNNVAHSLLLAAALSGMNFRIASPPGYQLNEQILNLAMKYARETGAEIVCVEEPYEAVSGADVVYTDVWTSMGQESEAEVRRKVFAKYQLNGALLCLAKENAIVMHPLPAHRGEEITDEVMECLQSVVFQQAENRMHAQKALLLRLLGASGKSAKLRRSF